MFEKKFKTSLLPLLNKIHFKRIIDVLLFSFFLWSIGFFVLSIVSMLTPVLFVNRILRYSFLAFICSGLIVGIFLRPKLISAIPIADSFGFNERLITSWELRKDNSEVALLQREDTLKKLGTINLSKSYKISINKKVMLASIIVFLFSLTLYYIPAQSKENAQKEEQVKRAVAKEVEKLDKEQEKQLEKYNIDAKQKEQLDKKLEELLKEIEESNSKEEAIKNLKIAKNEMEKLNSLKKLGEKMENTSLKQLAEELQQSDLDSIKKELEKLANTINKNSAQQNLELSKELQELAKQVTDNEQLRNNLLELANQLTSSNLEALAGALDALSSQLLNQAMGMNSDISSLASDMANAFMSSADNLASGLASDIPLNFRASGSSNGEGTQGAGMNDLEDGGTASNGAGTGSTNEESGYINDNGTVSHNDSNTNEEDKFGEYEELYVPDRLGGDTSPDFVPGQGTDSGQSSFLNVEGMPVEAGEIVPYKDVIGSYSESAIRTMNQMDIPSGMKDIVAEYFSSLD